MQLDTSALRHTALLSLALLDCPAQRAVADATSPAEPYVVLHADDAVVLVPSPAPARLARRLSAPAPDCAGIDASLRRFGTQIDQCKRPENQSSASCASLRSYVRDVARTRGPRPQPSLLQFWELDAESPRIADPDAWQEEAARELDLPREQVFVAESVEPQGAVATFSLTILPGTSWASRLAGFLTESDYMFGFDAETGTLRTEDQILACGLQVRDVQVDWTGPALARGRVVPTPLSADVLWSVYLELEAGPALANESTLVQGALLGRALGALGAEPVEQFLAQVAFAEQSLLDETGGLLALSEAEVRALAAREPPTATGSVRFRGNVP